jgi:uncharacterized membrane protein
MALDTMVVMAARYANEDDAIADYEEVKRVYEESDLLDTYDAAVVTRRDDGKVHIAKKHEQPTRHGALRGLGIGLAGGVLVALFPAVALGGALLVGGAGGAAVGALAGHVSRGMRRSDLKDLGELLDDGQSGMIVIAAADMEKHVEHAVSRALKISKKELKADDKQLEKELDEAVKG